MESPKIAVIHLGGSIPDGEETVEDYLLVRTPVELGDKIHGVKRFQGGVCHITKFHNDVVCATGVLESGEIVTCPIGELVDWGMARNFPVICNALMRPWESVCINSEQSKVTRIFMTSILRTLRWSSALNSPVDWRPASEGEKRMREIILSEQNQK